ARRSNPQCRSRNAEVRMTDRIGEPMSTPPVPVDSPILTSAFSNPHSKVGVLLIQLGTPDEPTAPALRRYLRQFLGDPRVIEVPRWKWRLILNLFILPFRPKQSAAKYRRIWHPVTGSPLLHYTRRQTEALQQLLPDVPVTFGMQVGNPPVAEAVRSLAGMGVERLIVLPMYPQYSAT